MDGLFTAGGGLALRNAGEGQFTGDAVIKRRDGGNRLRA